MDFESAANFTDLRSVINEAIDTHVPVSYSSEKKPMVELEPAQRFNNLWDRADLMLGTWPHKGGTIPARGKTASGKSVSVRLTLRTEPTGSGPARRTRVIEAQWSDGQPLGKPEVARDEPDFLKRAKNPNSHEARNLTLVEESLAAIEIIRNELKMPQSPSVLSP